MLKMGSKHKREVLFVPVHASSRASVIKHTKDFSEVSTCFLPTDRSYFLSPYFRSRSLNSSGTDEEDLGSQTFTENLFKFANKRKTKTDFGFDESLDEDERFNSDSSSLSDSAQFSKPEEIFGIWPKYESHGSDAIDRLPRLLDMTQASQLLSNNKLSDFARSLSASSVLGSNKEIKKTKSNLQCEYCHKWFTNGDAARRHLLTHNGKRTHKCMYCSRSFYDQTSFARHLKSHNGDKAHKCAQCSMAFSKRSALEVHIRTHTGERPFVCRFCGKGFSISGNLHRHALIHTGHRPYRCGKCPRAFNNPSHLARHISSFHT